EELPANRVYNHVSWAGVESDYLNGLCIGGNRGQIADTAEILQDAPAARVAKKGVIEEGNQGSTLATGRHIGGTKIREYWHSQPGGDDRRFASLPGGCDLAAEEVCGFALVIQSLAV